MGVECENPGKSTIAVRSLHRALDHRLVAEVDAIEHAQGEMQRDT
jgi:hypothetical protein